MKRRYKNFNVEESDIDRAVTACDKIDTAAEIFEDKFKIILDKQAPIKIFQMRKHYTPYLREETKLIMEVRKVLKEEMTKYGDKDLAKKVKSQNKEIKNSIFQLEQS